MGILPVRLAEGWGPARLRLQPGDRIEVDAMPGKLRPRGPVSVTILRKDGGREAVQATAAVETQFEVELWHDGGVLPHILRGARTKQAA